MSKEFLTWNDGDEEGKAKAMSQFSESVDAYQGVQKSSANRSQQTYIGVEPNISIRPEFGKQDYYAFRPGEQPSNESRRIIGQCLSAYEKVGIIRNIIDLMGDFGSQGIEIVHPNKSVERFYQQWFKSVNGKERSERFLNNLYKAGNVVVYRSNAQITPAIEKYLKSLASDIVVETPNVKANQIPWRYTFFNPLTVTLKDGELGLFLGKPSYEISTNKFLHKFENGELPTDVLESLPTNVKQAINSGAKHIPLEASRISVFHYKKDDWRQWANPMVYAILDDIIMLEKMRLADMAALDGAISNIRLWTLGSLDHKILPNKAAINKLRDILASNVGGGTMELVWGPELSFQESSSDIYKFLGSEKYTAVLNSIYAGLGVPPTLTGVSGNGGGFTNNFVSLKTLVERLQYGRDMLIKFWEKELELVRQAMGFRQKPYIHFDTMSFSNDDAQKNLLIQLADRDIISYETLLERFGEIPNIEKIRVNREESDRENEKRPPKADPYHNANHKQELEKIALQQGKVTTDDLDMESSVPKSRQMPPPPAPKNAPGNGPANEPKTPNENGRPKNQKDTSPRKQRDVKPRSKPGVAELLIWSEDAYAEASSIVNEAFLKSHGKKNLRQLNKLESGQLEQLKLDVFTNLPALEKVTASAVIDILATGKKTPQEFANTLVRNGISPETMSIEAYRRGVIGTFIDQKIG